MPSVEPSVAKTVLVTGANGYIALSVIKALLDDGFSVRGTVRTTLRIKSLSEIFSSYGTRVDWVVVGDISAAGAFDEAVKGVDAIEHIASPLDSETDDPNGYIKPAVDGTLGLLNSVLKFGKKVKRIVITSSCAAVVNPLRTGDKVIYTEHDWNDDAVNIVRREGKNASDMLKYRASKTLAEKAAWELYEKVRSEVEWDLVTLAPPLVIGVAQPSMQDLKDPSDLGASLRKWWGMVTNDDPSDPRFGEAYDFVDVRDLATAHLWAITKSAAGSERFIISAGTMTWQETRDRIYGFDPNLFSSGTLKRGSPGEERKYPTEFSNEKSKKLLDMKYRTADETVRDTITEFNNKGWLE